MGDVKGAKRNGKCMRERTEACVGLLKLSPKSLEIQVPSTGSEEKTTKINLMLGGGRKLQCSDGTHKYFQGFAYKKIASP